MGVGEITVAGPCGLRTQLPSLSGNSSLKRGCYYNRSTVVLQPFYNGEMSKSSVATVRETPVARTTSASAGGFMVVAETIAVDTSERLDLIDLTETVMAFVRRSGV